MADLDSNTELCGAQTLNKRMMKKIDKLGEGKYKSKMPAPVFKGKKKDYGSWGVINKSTGQSDNAVKYAIAAVQKQIDNDFAPAWGITTKLYFKAKDTPQQDDEVYIFIQDAPSNSDVTFGGDHNQYNRGFVYLSNITDFWTRVLSHEVLEMLADLDLKTLSSVQTWAGVRGSALLEVCDPCPTYYINNVHLSNFVYPNWFIPNSTGPFDFLQTMSKPQQCNSGGFITLQLLKPDGTPSGVWTEWNGSLVMGDGDVKIVTEKESWESDKYLYKNLWKKHGRKYVLKNNKKHLRRKKRYIWRKREGYLT
jgi:hypothetical protein